MLNKQTIRLLLIVSLSLLSFISYADGLPPLTHKLTAVNEIIKAPSLHLQNMDEEIIDLKDLKGKVVIVNFWATWCPPCRREMSSLERLYQATKDKNVEVLAVNIGEDFDIVFSFMGRVEPAPSFQILFDTEAESMQPWKVRGLPTTYIIRPDGTIAYKAIGGREFDHPELLEKVIKLNKSNGSPFL